MLTQSCDTHVHTMTYLKAKVAGISSHDGSVSPIVSIDGITVHCFTLVDNILEVVIVRIVIVVISIVVVVNFN